MAAKSRSTARQLVGILDSSSCPLYALDERRRIVYCNEACAAWLGVSRDRLLGLHCDYHSGDRGSDEVAAALCPPPQTFSGETARAAVVWRDDRGQPAEREAWFIPLECNAEWSVLAVVANADQRDIDRAQQPPISESAELHRRLRTLVRRNAFRYRVELLAGDSLAMRRVRSQVELAVGTQVCVVVLGPAGIGREHLARTIHSGSAAPGPLLPLTCPVLDSELLQTTIAAFLGHCREANKLSAAAILLLDADHLTPSAQVELLQALRAAGAGLRTLATARRSLLDLSAEGIFNRELAMSLSTLVIELPSLADRREDIPILAQQILESRNAGGARQQSGFASEVLDLLAALPWEQNLDELSVIVEQAARAAGGAWIEVADLPERVRLLQDAAAHPRVKEESLMLDEFLADVERELIRRALRAAKGNKAKAARLLGIQRARLLRRLDQLGLADH